MLATLLYFNIIVVIFGISIFLNYFFEISSVYYYQITSTILVVFCSDGDQPSLDIYGSPVVMLAVLIQSYGVPEYFLTLETEDRKLLF